VARERGIRNVAVTNGYITGRAAADAVEAIDAFNVDIKSMDSDFYRRNCGGRLEPVLEFCIAARRAGKHIEITNLIIPGENDSDGLILELAAWVACNLGREVPVHFSAYRPEFRMKKPATGVGILNRAYELAADGLDYVYLGNVVSERGQDTICPGCGSTLVARRVYSTAVRGVKDGRCSSCGFKLEGFVWQGE
jgi:pyruvate formate lyase activating enzyme